MRPRAILITIAALVALSCNERTFGFGIGRPIVEGTDRPTTLPANITELFVASADEADRYAKLTVDGCDGNIACNLTDGLQLCGGGDCVDLTGALPAAGVFQIFLRDDGTHSFDFSPSVGEIAVVDGTGLVHAYLAWGADPALWSSEYALEAVMSGVAVAGGFAPVGFPMPVCADLGVGICVGIAVIGGQSGCAEFPDPAAIEPTLCPQGDRLAISAVSAVDSRVEIANSSAVDVDLFAARICAPPSCPSFLRGSVVAAGSTQTVFVGVAAPTATPAEIYLEQAKPLPSGGELALLAPGAADIEDSSRVLSLVRFGDSEQTTWCAPAAAGTSVDPFVISAVRRTAPQMIELTNRGTVASDMNDYVLVLDGVNQRVLTDVGTVDPDGVVTIELDGDLDGCAAALCWADAGAVLNDAGTLAITRSAQQVGFMQWGFVDGGSAALAVAAALWPAPFCSLPELVAGDSFVLRAGFEGTSPVDYD